MHTTGILWVFKRAELSEPAVHLCSIVRFLALEPVNAATPIDAEIRKIDDAESE